MTKQSKVTRELKARSQKIAKELPERLLKGNKAISHKARHRKLIIDSNAIIELSYNHLDGEWADWLEVARRYEVKVPSQDRFDMRHTILIELAEARKRDSKPLPLLRAYRIASLMVALYWRELAKHQVKVCIYSGLPVEPHCASCRHNGESPCPYLASRPIQSLDSEATDSEGHTVRLKDTVADDHAVDTDAWLDAKTWLLGCPLKLIQIGYKRQEGIPLTKTDRQYLWRYLKRHQKPLPIM